MNEPFEGYGRWWLPNYPELSGIQFFGKVSWNPYSGAILEAPGLDSKVFDHLSSLFGHGGILIHGQLDSLPFITLENATLTSTTNDHRVTFAAHKIARGVAVLKCFDDTQLNSLSCEITGLARWMGGTSIKVENKNKETHVICSGYRDEKFTEISGFKINLARWNRSSYGADSFSANGAFSVELESEVPFPFVKAMDLMNIFRDFISLALDRPVVFTAISGALTGGDHKMPDGKSVPGTIDFLTCGNESIAIKAKAEGKSFRIPFILNQGIESAKAFKKFHEIRDTNRMALDFFFSHYYTDGSFITQQFSDMVHALEGLHRGTRGGTFIDSEKYNKNVLPKLLSAIPDGADSNLKQALKKRLEYGNELSLRRRLKELARTHDEYTRQIIGKPTDFADLLADSRNNLAHALGAKKTTTEDFLKYFVHWVTVKTTA